MIQQVTYTSQTRLDFDIDKLIQAGIRRAYVSPFKKNNELLCTPDVIIKNLEKLAVKAAVAGKKGLEVYPFFVTINHPEGNFEVPNRYRCQQNIDGTERQAFICFRDKIRQKEMLLFATKTAELGFARIVFDDDLRDAFCYCDEHIYSFDGFKDKTRVQIAEILNGILTHPEHEQLRLAWYRYKYEGMKYYAMRIEHAVHAVNPYCRIGICNSAKRCQDFSGRNPYEWLKLFSTEKAPSFVRLCGECYDDSIVHLAQSSGWHDYFNRIYPEKIERKAELTSVPAIAYRSPRNVILEAEAVIAATGVKTVHWAWTEEFEHTGLMKTIRECTQKLNELTANIELPTISPLAVYIGQQLGGYMPIGISTIYGATHDPITAYNIVALVGLPVIATPEIQDNQPAIICSAYISREMIANIDNYVSGGGVAILDVKAAQCYRTYGGSVRFEIKGPISLHSHEISASGAIRDFIAECPPDAVYSVSSDAAVFHCTSYSVDGATIGNSCIIVPYGKGNFILFGYDFSRTKTVLLRHAWRSYLIEMLKNAGVEIPVYWDGPVAVQCHYYGNNKIGMVNYNANTVNGIVHNYGEKVQISLGASSVKIISLSKVK